MKLRFPKTIVASYPEGAPLKSMTFVLTGHRQRGEVTVGVYQAAMPTAKDKRVVGTKTINYNDLTLHIFPDRTDRARTRFDCVSYLLEAGCVNQRGETVFHAVSRSYTLASNMKERNASFQPLANAALRGYNFDRTNPNLVQ